MRVSGVTPYVAVAAALVCAALVSGCSKKSEAGGSNASQEETASAGEGRIVVGEHGFAPSALVVRKREAGSVVPITFFRTTEETCAKEVVFPELGIKKDLPLKTPVTIDVPADNDRTLTFQCGMAMYKGALVVK